jgi:hypothetical protein
MEERAAQAVQDKRGRKRCAAMPDEEQSGFKINGECML